MIKLIHKEVLSELGIITELTLPSSSQIVSIQNQNNRITIWYEFTKDDLLTKVFRFKVVNTGMAFDKGFGNHLATVALYSGDLIKHIYSIP